MNWVDVVNKQRRSAVARVHIAKKEMRLDDAAYRSLIERVTGKISAGDCSVGQLGLVLEEMRRLGWKPAKGRRRPLSKNPQVRMIYAIWGDIRPLLDDAGDTALRGFVRRQTKGVLHPDGVSAPEFLNPEQAILVIEGLKGWRGRLLAANKGSAA